MGIFESIISILRWFRSQATEMLYQMSARQRQARSASSSPAAAAVLSVLSTSAIAPDTSGKRYVTPSALLASRKRFTYVAALATLHTPIISQRNQHMSNLPAVEATKRAVHDTRTRVLLSKTKMTSPAAPVFPHRLSGTGRRPADRSHRFRRA